MLLDFTVKMNDSFIYRATGDKDVTIKVLYCGVCHTDLHMVKNEWGVTPYPLVPGYTNIQY